MRQYIAYVLVSVATVSSFSPYSSFADVVADWDYGKLAAKSDMVVIASVIATETVDFDFTATYWKSAMLHPVFGPKVRDILVAEVTTFRVKAILRGPASHDTVQVFHYSFKREPDFIENRSRFLKEGLTGSTEGEVSPESHYLLFLKRRSDGMFEAATGQEDAAFSVKQVRSLVRKGGFAGSSTKASVK